MFSGTNNLAVLISAPNVHGLVNQGNPPRPCSYRRQPGHRHHAQFGSSQGSNFSLGGAITVEVDDSRRAL